MVLVRHGDIGIKSNRVQTSMERRLRDNIQAVLDDRDVPGEVERDWGRLYVRVEDPAVAPEAARAAAATFGVVSASPARSVPPSLDAISTALAETAAERYTEGTFAIDARRTGEHDFTSQDVGEVGGEAVWNAVQDEFDPAVDLDDPDLTLSVEVRQDEAFVFVDDVQGPGGLPVGSQAPVVALVSGGIDSPVAAYLAMKRGAPVLPIYLDLGQYGGPDHRARAISTIETLAAYAPHRDWTVRVVPVGEYLERLVERVGDTRMLSFRRFMYRIAGHVAAEEGAVGIVTGEAIGQKSSQTTTNLGVVDRASELPIHRPLLSRDKQEIISLSKEIGTYEDAIVDTGCNRIAPEQAATRASLETVTGAEPDDLFEWAATAAERREVVRLDRGGQPQIAGQTDEG